MCHDPPGRRARRGRRGRVRSGAAHAEAGGRLRSIAPLGLLLGVVVLNGLFAAVAYQAHYRALSLGPVAVVSPIGPRTPSLESRSPLSSSASGRGYSRCLAAF